MFGQLLSSLLSKISGGGGSSKPLANPQPKPAPAPAPTSNVLGASKTNTGYYTTPQPMYAQPAGPVNPNPSTSGQSYGNSAPASSGTINLTAPSYSPPDTSGIDQLRSAYSQARDSISGQQGILDSSYNTAKNDISGALTDAQKQADTQKETVGSQFGDVLKNQLQTYKDLAQQRQGVFSSLGTLDSSAFGDQQFKADQQFADQRTKTDLEKQRTLKSIDDQFNTYQRQASSQLADLANQYQQGKNAIASALANNNIQEAGAIQSALEQIRNQASQVQNSLINFANQAQMLKAQGLNVKTNIAGVSGNQYAQDTQNFLNNYMNQQQSLLKIPAGASQLPGYIGRSKNPNDPYGINPGA